MFQQFLRGATAPSAYLKLSLFFILCLHFCLSLSHVRISLSLSLFHHLSIFLCISLCLSISFDPSRTHRSEKGILDQTDKRDGNCEALKILSLSRFSLCFQSFSTFSRCVSGEDCCPIQGLAATSETRRRECRIKRHRRWSDCNSSDQRRDPRLGRLCSLLVLGSKASLFFYFSSFLFLSLRLSISSFLSSVLSFSLFLICVICLFFIFAFLCTIVPLPF